MGDISNLNTALIAIGQYRYSLRRRRLRVLHKTTTKLVLRRLPNTVKRGLSNVRPVNVSSGLVPSTQDLRGRKFSVKGDYLVVPLPQFLDVVNSL